MSLDQAIRKHARRKPKGPIWKGPEEDGITQSLLSRFLVCRERFRLLVVEGLKPADEFNHRIEYGSMWHVCEEAYAKAPGDKHPKKSREDYHWEFRLRQYAQKLCKRYQGQQEQIQHWYNVCKIQFPTYVDYWAKHNTIKNRQNLLSEGTFCVLYELPSGRVVKLRGKWDSVDLIGKGKRAGIYLQENKTKGDIKEEQLRRQLESGFDLQTMLYLVALQKKSGDSPQRLEVPGVEMKSWPLKGVIYNVVRRPLSGGKHSIRQHKPTKKSPSGESTEAFYKRLGGLIAEEPKHYFMRWKVEISPQDIERFRGEFLTPILEHLCDWWEHHQHFPGYAFSVSITESGRMDRMEAIHWRTPFGFYNSLAERGSSELDEYLRTGSEAGLTRTTELFPELA